MALCVLPLLVEACSTFTADIETPQTTLAVVNYSANLIVYPGYTDAEVASGAVVTPDKSYAPQAVF